MKSILKLAAAVAIVGSASIANAQSGNGSDVTGPPAGSAPGGTFAPHPVPRGGAGNGGGANAGGAGGVAGAAVSQTAQSFSNGSAHSDPATGQTISPAAVAAIGSLLTGGSPASVTAVSNALTAGGAPAGLAANLVQALANLSSVSSATAPATILAALNAFNALVAGAPASFRANPPAEFVAIHAALTPMAQAMRH